MKEKSFKFKESFAKAIAAMDDKQAGRFIKSLSDYAFKGKEYEGNDATIKSTFLLVKNVIDENRMYAEYGKIGARISAELCKVVKEKPPYVKRIITNSYVTEGFIRDVIITGEKPKKSDQMNGENDGKSVADDGGIRAGKE